MALNTATAEALGTSIASALTGLSADDKNNAEKIWQEIMKLIYAALVTDAQVLVTSVSGVSPGGGTSGPGTGTLS